MLAIAFFQWWYGRGWVQQFQAILGKPRSLLSSFDVGTLIATLFSPWKRDASRAFKDQSLAAKFRTFIDNLISRFVGFWIRFLTLLAVLAGSLLLIVFNVTLAVIWPLAPFLPIILLIMGVTRL